MKYIFKKSSNILKNNLIFIQPLLLFLLICITAASYILAPAGIIIQKIILAFIILLMLIIFSAGWFHINKEGVINYDENDSFEVKSQKAIKNFKTFFEGVGANFIKTFLGYIFIFALYAITFYFMLKGFKSVFGIPQIIQRIPELAHAGTNIDIINFLNDFSEYDKAIFSIYIMCTNILFFILCFISTVYFAAMFLSGTNVIESMGKTIVFIIKNIWNCMFIILALLVLYILLNIFSAALGVNSFSFVILIILFTIYLNYGIILIFCFYNDKTKINSDNRSEFIG
ncbi:MAG: hypothetical protein LUG16_08860 [Candidatus Gastranaerophilales bacterium]|nr:hypothetical protein [Candidatus Gastranaerophilales bacterium]